jgi:hypothetical protein
MKKQTPRRHTNPPPPLFPCQCLIRQRVAMAPLGNVPSVSALLARQRCAAAIYDTRTVRKVLNYLEAKGAG